jgi:hypothetical protein
LLDDLRALVEFAHAGSIVGAADRLFRTPSAITRQALDDHLGEVHMEIKRNGTQPSSKAPAEWFAGEVRIDPLFEAPSPSRGRGASVTFEPGARSAWHTHPLGQVLIVTAGVGVTQSGARRR